MASYLSTQEEAFLSRLEGILSNQNKTVLHQVGEVSRKVDMFDDRIKTVEQDINFMKYERPVERREAAKIRRAVSRRVCELLEVPLKKDERTLEDKIKYKKYSRHLFGKCYSEIPYEGHMAKGSYLDTPKREYDATLADIDAYSPIGGMKAFYEEVDREALANCIAREQGYEG